MMEGSHIVMMERRMETIMAYRGYIVVTEKRMETTIAYSGCIVTMEKRLDTETLQLHPQRISVSVSHSKPCGVRT